MTRKGQSAMEYLMTYGWAILVIIIVIAVLFYIGVLNPRNVTPSSCTFPPGISCASYKLHATDGEFELSLGQATGQSIRIEAIKCTQNTTAAPTFTNTSDNTEPWTILWWNTWGFPGYTSYGVTIPVGEQRWVSSLDSTKGVGAIYCTTDQDGDPSANAAWFGNCAGCKQIATGEMFKGKIYIFYTEVGTGINRTVAGDISAKFE